MPSSARKSVRRTPSSTTRGASWSTMLEGPRRPASAGRRGPSSIVLQDAPLVVLDGVRLTDFRALDGIPAVTILLISIYTGIEGTTYYGTNAVSGVIVIKTKDGPEP